MNYYNWTGAIRLPGVMQYVKKLAKLVGEHIKKGVNTSDFSEIIKLDIQKKMFHASKEEQQL